MSLFDRRQESLIMEELHEEVGFQKRAINNKGVKNTHKNLLVLSSALL